jgi:site-specific DNA recombinase
MAKKTIQQGVKKVTTLYPLPDMQDNAQKNKLRTAAYCRVSTDSEQQLSSYRAQVKHYKSYLTNHPDYTFSGVYADEGESGTAMKKRTAFLKLLADCREGKIDLIITKSVSRFGRNTVDCLNCVRELHKLGVVVLFEKENIQTNRGDGELFLTLMSAVAQAESMAQSENVKWGIRHRYQ